MPPTSSEVRFDQCPGLMLREYRCPKGCTHWVIETTGEPALMIAMTKGNVPVTMASRTLHAIARLADWTRPSSEIRADQALLLATSVVVTAVGLGLPVVGAEIVDVEPGVGPR